MQSQARRCTVDAIFRRILLVTAGFCLAAVSEAGIPPPDISGFIETYFQAARPGSGLSFNENVSQERVRFSDQWRVVFTQYYVPGDLELDENFVEYDQPTFVTKLGRMRSMFGFSQWSDTNYNVELQDPMIRSTNVLPRLGLNRLDDGAEVQLFRGDYQLVLGAFDVYSGDEQLAPKRVDHFQGRLQRRFGSLMLGVNGLARSLSARDSEGQAYSGDFRWTSPHWLARGEIVRGDSPGFSTDGYYVDFTYRSPNLYRTELGVRNEAFGVRGSGQRSSVTTIGARHIFGPSFTCNLNFGWGKATSEFDSRIGWSFQTVYYVHF